jgi:anthranilate synthase component 1
MFGVFNFLNMRLINYTTTAKKMSADIYTPVSIYLRIRDHFRDAVLLESTDFSSEENSYSFIGINALAGIEINATNAVEYRLPNEEAKIEIIDTNEKIMKTFEAFMQSFVASNKVDYPLSIAQSLLGYMCYNSVQLFETITLSKEVNIPIMRFRFYQYIIAINHFKDELYLIENQIENIENSSQLLETLIQKKDVPQFPFTINGIETSNCTDLEYKAMVETGIEHCKIGDVFQVVLSRQFKQSFIGDEFNVYRNLRNVNPSPYLFYFDYGNYRIFGSSPESQLIIKNGEAFVHPIAGTVIRTGNVAEDEAMAAKLKIDAKENAEHTMLVDLARNDLSQICDDVHINYYKSLKQYSHLIHLVSEVSGKMQKGNRNLFALGKTFPAGTLSGAPKYKAMQIIDVLEIDSRDFYGGAIGILGFDGSCNMAILIRSFLSKDNTLTYQAGAGIVAASIPESELQEVNNKIAALRLSVELANQK